MSHPTVYSMNMLLQAGISLSGHPKLEVMRYSRWSTLALVPARRRKERRGKPVQPSQLRPHISAVKVHNNGMRQCAVHSTFILPIFSSLVDLIEDWRP